MADLVEDIDLVLLRLDEVNKRIDNLVVEARASSNQKTFSPVSIQPKSSNRKLSPVRWEKARSGRMRPVPDGPPFVASTWVSISGTCPDVCTFKDNGCYAQAGATHLVMGRLDRAARGREPLSVTLEEAAEIDRLFVSGVPQDGARGGRDLRLHVGGDVSCRKGAKALGEAVTRFQKRGGGRCWTYTHRWREISRDSWGPISVLASVERHEEMPEARRQGYTPAVTVPAFPDGHERFQTGSFTAVPCPYEANRSVTCATCRLCFDDRRLFERREAIAFAVHGAESEKAIMALTQIRLPGVQ